MPLEHWFYTIPLRFRSVLDLLQDVCYAFRILAKAPGFTIVATLVLALGIGANTAVFTIVNGVLLQPLPFSEPSRLFLISAMPRNNPFIAPGPFMSDRDYLRFRSQDHAFESTATFGKEPVTLTGAGDPVALNALVVTPDFFKVLGVRPTIGRAFLPEGRGDSNVVLLSDRLWHGRFGGDLTIIGKAITLDGIRYAIAGVMPGSFTFQEAELWKRMEVKLDPHNSFVRAVIGRLKPGVSRRQAQAELQAFAAVQPIDEGEKREHSVTPIIPLQELSVADGRRLLLVFAGAVVVVFLIACANFANLLLIRGGFASAGNRCSCGVGRKPLAIGSAVARREYFSFFCGSDTGGSAVKSRGENSVGAFAHWDHSARCSS